MSAAPAPSPVAATRPGARAVLGLLAATASLAVVASLAIGALRLGPGELASILLGRVSGAAGDAVRAEVVWNIRLPRVLLGASMGAGLAASGAAMQGLFRNPLADPALLGVSSGASLGAVFVIVVASTTFGRFPPALAAWVLPAAAFAGGLGATWASVAVSRVEGRARPAVMLLAGVAVNALAGAGIGLAMHVASDAQLRSITFWTLGSLGGATWRVVAVAAPLILAGVVALQRFARPLNLLLLGEREARHLGVDARGVQRSVVALTALIVGASVATAGIIGFVGLVVPSACRLLLGPDHRRLLPAAALLGSALLVTADTLARVVVAPAELPVGVLTAALGAPLFLARIARARGGEVFS